MHSKELCYSKEKAVNSHKCRHSSQFIPANIPESIQSSEQWAVVCELDRTIYTCSKRFELICKVCFGQSCVNTINKQSLRFIVNLLCMLWMVSILLIKMGASKQNLHFWCWRQNLHSNVPTDYRMLHASLMVFAYVHKKSLIQLFLGEGAISGQNTCHSQSLSECNYVTYSVAEVWLKDLHMWRHNRWRPNPAVPFPTKHHHAEAHVQGPALGSPFLHLSFEPPNYPSSACWLIEQADLGWWRCDNGVQH